MRRFTVRASGEPELDKVQYWIKGAFDELAAAVEAMQSSIAGGAGGSAITVPYIANEVTFGDPAGSGRLVQNARFLFDPTSHALTVGSSALTGPLNSNYLGQINAVGSGSTFRAFGFTGIPSFDFWRSQGTQVSPSNVAAGVTLGQLDWHGRTANAGVSNDYTLGLRQTVFVDPGSTPAPGAILATWRLGHVLNGVNEDQAIATFAQGAGGNALTSVVLGYTGLAATTDTGGFVWFPSMNGAPSGVPTSPAVVGSNTALKIDVPHKRLYGYLGGAWHYAAFDDGAAGSAITSLTGDVTGTGPGAAATTIANNAVTFAKMQTIADQRLVGNVSGGTAVPAALTQAQIFTFLGIALTNKDVLYATGGTTIGQDANFQYDHAASTLSALTVQAATVQGGAGTALDLKNAASPATIISLQSSLISVTGNVVPASDLTYNLGASGKAWANLWVETIGKASVPGVFELITSQGPLIDSNTTGNFQVTHQSTNGRFISDATGIAFFQNPGGSPVGVAQQTGGAFTFGATYTAAEQAKCQVMWNALRAYGLLT